MEAPSTDQELVVLREVADAARKCVAVDMHHKECICSLCKALRKLDEFNELRRH